MVSGLEAVKRRRRRKMKRRVAPALVEVGVMLMVLVASFGLNVPKKATVLASPAVRVSP
jgi:hypothetical protein